MAQFHTVQEAATLTNKSPSSIRRRIIYPILKDDKHADRQYLQPSIEEATKLRSKGENFAWKISDDLLRRLMPTESSTEKKTRPSTQGSSMEGSSELLAMLRGELEIKNEQITQQSEMLSRQMELMNGLSERLREGNMLIGTLQQRLALTDGSSRATTTFVDARPKKSGGGEPSPTKQAKQKAKIEKPKRGFFSRLFN